MYLLKIKGVSQKSDHIQIRDDNFTLILYFRLSTLHKSIANSKFAEHEEKLIEIIKNAEYGKIQSINLQ